MDETVGPIESEGISDETGIGRGCPTLQSAIVCANDTQRIAIAGPPGNQPIRGRETTRAVNVEYSDHGVGQEHEAKTPSATDSRSLVRRTHIETSRARRDLIKVLYVSVRKTV